MARTFNLHPDTVRHTFTLRQALAHMNYELGIWRGKFSILADLDPVDQKEQQRRLREEAAAFFMRHRKESDHGETL